MVSPDVRQVNHGTQNIEKGEMVGNAWRLGAVVNLTSRKLVETYANL
jgi:hypothetical protein